MIELKGSFLNPSIKGIPARYDHNCILKRNLINPYVCIK